MVAGAAVVEVVKEGSGGDGGGAAAVCPELHRHINQCTHPQYTLRKAVGDFLHTESGKDSLVVHAVIT